MKKGMLQPVGEEYEDIIHLPHPVSKKHPPMSLADRAAQFSPFAALTGRLSWQQLANERLVILDRSYGLNGIIRDSFQQAGLTPNIVFECDQVDGILGMVQEGFGTSILSKKVAMAHYRVVAVPMQMPISRDTVLVVRRDVESRHLLAGRFVRHIVQYYENTKGNTASF